MKQEQKTFEIKETGDFKLEYSGYGANYVNEEVEGYVNAANAEIRRLQEQVLGFERDTTDWQLEVANLRQQLADAPTWGEWMDATAENLNNSARLPTVPYEVEGTDGKTWISMNGFIRFTLDDNAVRFRRLNYEPKPAREVEKKYTNSDGGEFTLTQLSKIDSYIVGELAADLLTLQEKHAAAQAELRELKGASDAESK